MRKGFERTLSIVLYKSLWCRDAKGFGKNENSMRNKYLLVIRSVIVRLLLFVLFGG